MAKRYSGDAEVRVGWDARRRAYYGYVRDPYVRPVHGTAPRRGTGSPTSPEAYDEAARVLLAHALKKSGGRLMLDRKRGRIQVSRMFVSPCPVGKSW